MLIITHSHKIFQSQHFNLIAQSEADTSTFIITILEQYKKHNHIIELVYFLVLN